MGTAARWREDQNQAKDGGADTQAPQTAEHTSDTWLSPTAAKLLKEKLHHLQVEVGEDKEELQVLHSKLRFSSEFEGRLAGRLRNTSEELETAEHAERVDEEAGVRLEATLQAVATRERAFATRSDQLAAEVRTLQDTEEGHDLQARARETAMARKFEMQREVFARELAARDQQRKKTEAERDQLRRDLEAQTALLATKATEQESLLAAKAAELAAKAAEQERLKRALKQSEAELASQKAELLASQRHAAALEKAQTRSVEAHEASRRDAENSKRKLTDLEGKVDRCYTAMETLEEKYAAALQEQRRGAALRAADSSPTDTRRHQPEKPEDETPVVVAKNGTIAESGGNLPPPAADVSEGEADEEEAAAVDLDAEEAVEEEDHHPAGQPDQPQPDDTDEVLNEVVERPAPLPGGFLSVATA